MRNRNETITLHSYTKLSDLLSAYPWLNEALPKVNEKFRLLHSPLGKVMLKTATIFDMSKRAGMNENVLIEKLNALIASHE